MSLILNIDCAVENASICLANDNDIVAFEVNFETKNHGSFLQPAIEKMFQQLSISLNNLDAISVSNGPGSYTGLRVSLASAKGLCFALNKPLIALNTLQIIANAELESNVQILKSIVEKNELEIKNKKSQTTLICPMIDARRMEVYTSVFDKNLQEILSTQALILQENSLEDLLESNKIIFCGNGAKKFETICKNSNAIFSLVNYTAKNMVALSLDKYNKKVFEDLAYCSPNYGKEFYSTMKIN